LTSILLAIALLQAAPVATDGRETDVAASQRGVDQLLLQEVRRIAARVEILRGESFVRQPFAVRVPEVMRDVAAQIRAFSVLPRDSLAARGRAWSDIGLGGAEAPRNLMLALAADLDGIGFDPKGNRLLVTPGRLKPEDFEPTGREDDPAAVLMATGMRPDEPLVAHLLAHVRQRERSGRDVLEATTDRLLASMAWAEGEANLIAVAYLFTGVSVGGEVLPFLKSPAAVLDGVLLPSGLERLSGVERELVDFVYVEGFERAAEQYRSGGWEALAEAIADRRTTSDLVHPERSALPEVDFPVAPEPPRAGLRVADVDSLGEQAIVVLVSSLTEKDSLGLLAGEGWAGDRLYRWEPDDASGGEWGITEWVTRWRSIGDDPGRPAADVAADFDYAYGRALEARFPGHSFAELGQGVRTMVAPDRIYRIERSPSTGSGGPSTGSGGPSTGSGGPSTGSGGPSTGSGQAEVRVLVQPLEAWPEPVEERSEPARDDADPSP
jgi:hypothetical protein